MDDESFIEELKSQADILREKTLSTLLAKDADYRIAENEVMQAEMAYKDLELTTVQKEIIDSLLNWIDNSNAEYSTLSYLAGLKDSQRIYGSATLAENIKSKDILSQLYNGQISSDEIYSTNEILKESRKLGKKEEQLVSRFSEEQNICFKEFLNEVNHLHSLELENHFIYGFKLGVKILMNVFDTK